MSVTNSLASLATATASAIPTTTSLIARAVAATSTTDPCPKITISLTTVLTISAFPFPTPSGASLENYRPKYKPALADGSIITDFYATDLALANVRLLGVGALLMYFIVSTINAIRYLRRSRAKDKTLFYLLVASQIPGPICFLALGISWFNENASCTVINIVASLSIEISYSILITGILGLKVYRVFNQSKIILSIVTALQIAAFAVFALDLPNIDSMRRISGSCDTRGTMKFMPISIILTFIESLVCSLAFLFAVWKMSQRPDTQGRISLALSLEENVDETSADRRGWWDYVPNENISGQQDQQPQQSNMAPAQDNVSLWRMGSLLSRFGNKTPQPSDPSPSLERKSSLPTDRPLPQPRPPLRRDQLDQMEKAPRRHRHSSSVGHEPPRSTPIVPLHPNYNRRSSQTRLPRMLLMRAVIRSELFYTTGIMLSCVVAAVISVIAAASANVTFGPSIWLGANWAITSLLVMRSFEMVVRRQDKETYIQSPTAWYPSANPDNAPTTSFRPRRMPTSPHLRLRRQQVDSYDDSSDFVGPLDEETGRVVMDPFDDFAGSRNSSPPASPRWGAPPITRRTSKTPSRRTGSPPAPLTLTQHPVATSSAIMIVPGSPAAHDLDASMLAGLPNPYSIQAVVASPESPALASEFEPSPTQSEMRLKL